MKRLTILFAVAVAAMATAITANAQISVGAGYGLATTIQKIDNADDADDDELNGFYVGVAYEFELLSRNWGVLSVQPGVTYSYYGDSETERDEILGVQTLTKASVREHYLDVPVNVKYSFDILPGTLKVAAYAGPMLSFGLSSAMVARAEAGDTKTVTRTDNYSGNVSMKVTTGGETSTTNTDGNGTGYGMFDLKLGVGLAVTVAEKIGVKVGYNFGLLDRMDTDNVKWNTNVFQAGLTFNF